MSTNVATQNKSNTAGMSKVRFITQVGMLGAIAVILMAFEIPLPFAPAFYKIDFSEVPALIGCFAMGPAAGAMIELVKIVLHLLISGTSTAGVGDIANFAIGCAFILPAAWIYKAKHSRKSAMIGMAAGTVFMAFIGCDGSSESSSERQIQRSCKTLQKKCNDRDSGSSHDQPGTCKTC